MSDATKIKIQLVEMQWNGKETTLIRPRHGAPKVEVEPGGKVVVEKQYADQISNAYKEWKVLGAAGVEEFDKVPDEPKSKKKAAKKKDEESEEKQEETEQDEE